MPIVCCGTGRCGTKSLVDLLDGCSGFTCTHEMRPILPWEVDEVLLEDRIQYFKQNPNSGDVAFYYLPYIEKMFDSIDELRVICLERDREKVVDSFMAKTNNLDPPRNHWANHDGEMWSKDPLWDQAFPNYNYPNNLEPDRVRRLLISEYWQKYHDYATWLSDNYRDFCIFDTDNLNYKEGQRAIFDFLDLEPNYNVGIKKNELVSK